MAPERDEAPGFRREHFDYARLIAYYDRLFGADNVHVFRYEDFRADPRGFAATYAARFGLDITLDRLDWGTRNPSPGRLLLWAFRAANLFTRRAVADKDCLLHLPGWYGFSRKLLRRANASGRFGRPLRMRDILDEGAIAHFNDYYRHGEAAIADRLEQQTCRDAKSRDGMAATAPSYARSCRTATSSLPTMTQHC